MKVRVRFAPSPTGVLHIGGVRTALYNYLFAKQHGGAFILRVEDTDRTRYVPGAEEYIIETLRWTGLIPDEGVGFGGDKGPYRQSDRKAIYADYAAQLVARGHAYYAFDTAEALEKKRNAIDNFTYNHTTRGDLDNSLTISQTETDRRLAGGEPAVIRLKVMPGQSIKIDDMVRGTVVFQSSELDDKVLLKADGMPTYHLANIVDDHLMEVTHVIRGEEWLPSTAHHVLLYSGFGWEDTMPRFAHLPLILKPVGNGKLSKRDGAKLGIPVFPLEWAGPTPEESFQGFRSVGFLPEAMLNFMALLGWHPGDDREIFDLTALSEHFSFDHISKGGARFDFEKAKWFNQKYIQAAETSELVPYVKPIMAKKGYACSDSFLERVITLMKDRAVLIPDFVEEGYYFFEMPRTYDADMVSKKWNPEIARHFDVLTKAIATLEPFNSQSLEAFVKTQIEAMGLKPGDLFPLLRIALAGTMKGPAVFEMAEVLGKEETIRRLEAFLTH